MATPPPLASVCLFCGSASGSDPAYLAAASAFGRITAEQGVRLVYGGGGVGLMGAAAKAAVAAGGEVLGVIPQFLCLPEVAYDGAPTQVVSSMHERKAAMFEASDGFVVLPGGVGTIEEIIEILSWARVGLHAKPAVFLNLNSYWTPLFDLIEHTMDQGFTPKSFRDAFRAVDEVEALLPTLVAMRADSPSAGMTPLSLT